MLWSVQRTKSAIQWMCVFAYSDPGLHCLTLVLFFYESAFLLFLDQ